MKALGLAAVVLLMGCGGGLADADARSLQNSERATLDALELCASPATTCNAAQVRADMRAVRCSDGSVLKRNGATVPTGGLDGCPAR